ncbi:MAG: tetratricopeptide repeat protein [Planctomycetota bacterium]|jgi:hypothetical protein
MKQSRIIVLVSVAMTAGVCASRADQVVVRGKNYPAAKIRELNNGRLTFRKASGQEQAPWVVDIDRITVDRDGPFQDFNEAERYREKNEIDLALERYRRTQRMVSSYWPELIDARILQTLNATGRTRDSVRAFTKVVRGQFTGPALGARMFPTNLPDKMTKPLNEAILDLNTEISKTQNPQHRSLLMILKYELLRHVNDRRAVDMVNTVARLSIDSRARTTRVYQIILHAQQALLDKEKSPETLAALDTAIKHCPKGMLASFLMLKSETLLATASTDDELIRASWPLMRIAIHMPNDPLAGEGLYRTGLILERLGRSQKAISLIEESLALGNLSDETRTAAGAVLERLQKGKIKP